MSELTPEEKKKIYEEEKARIEAQEKITKDKQEAASKKSNTGCLGIIGAVAIVVIIMWIGGVFKSEKKSTTPSKPLYIDLNASVRFTGTQFVITNNDSFNWTNVELEINAGVLKGGYKLNAGLMNAGETYTVGAMQFAKGDGTRFNPLMTKPQSITISCDTPEGEGFYNGKWD